MLIFRSLIFNLLFYFFVVVFVLIALPALVLPSRCTVRVAQWWGTTTLWLVRIICGLKFEIRGREHIPQGAFLVASKHQSAWETFALFPPFAFPTMVLKRELTWIPFFGWTLIKGGMIALDRGAGKEALANLIARVRAALSQGRQVIVFPEGTRRPPGAEPDYKLGVVQLYTSSGAACLPVALNSGMFWPRRSFLRYPGTVIVEILPPIPAGLPRAVFFRRLQNDLETATNRLIAEAQRERGISSLPHAAQAPQLKDL
ncbi:MAG: lysophospholipid acyltransferase family protein [Xanthobacteraceae bacterium]